MLKLTKVKALMVAVAVLAASLVGIGGAPKVAHAQFGQQAPAYGAQYPTSRASRAFGAFNPHTDGGTDNVPDLSGYDDVFSNITATMTGAVNGPGKLAIGALVLGLIFGVVWKLTRKGVKSIG